jgi:L-amino acid N-acyltransferase YncA
MEIEPLTEKHWPEVSAIYESGLATGNANFSLQVPDWEEWDKTHLKSCRLVMMDSSKVWGWAALTAISDRCVYGGVAEVSVYVHESARNKGIGKQWLKAIADESEKNNLWTLEARIFAENLASLKAHEANGFHTVGRRERIGKLNGVWRDVILMERRSINVGV